MRIYRQSKRTKIITRDEERKKEKRKTSKYKKTMANKKRTIKIRETPHKRRDARYDTFIIEINYIIDYTTYNGIISIHPTRNHKEK